MCGTMTSYKGFCQGLLEFSFSSLSSFSVEWGLSGSFGVSGGGSRFFFPVEYCGEEFIVILGGGP